jgi:magnesium chelatase accessory protein
MFPNPAPPSFARDGADWPLRETSRFVEAGGFDWHVQRLGRGPPLLLLHGTGGATHSWRSLAPLLAERFDVVAFDLPGHGFTTPRPGSASFRHELDLSLPGMAAAVRALLNRLAFEPRIALGHSAGAAILVQLCADKAIAPDLLVGVNAALRPFEGWAGRMFPAIARLMFLNPVTPRLFAWSADEAAVANMIRGMGSRIDARGVQLYARLLANPAHCAGALGMMANWRLETLAPDFPRVPARTLLIVGANDKAVPPADAREVAKLFPDACVETLPGLGHLAHEEKPAEVARLVFAYAQAARG